MLLDREGLDLDFILLKDSFLNGLFESVFLPAYLFDLSPSLSDDLKFLDGLFESVLDNFLSSDFFLGSFLLDYSARLLGPLLLEKLLVRFFLWNVSVFLFLAALLLVFFFCFFAVLGLSR